MAAELDVLELIFQDENLSIYSRDSSCRAVWSIPDFNLLMKRSKMLPVTEPHFRFSSRLSGLPPVVSCRISCNPCVRYSNGYYYVEITVALHPHSGSSIRGRLEVSIGVLNVDGVAHIWETFEVPTSNQEDRMFTAYKSFHDLTSTGNETHYLMPDGSLTIFVNISCPDGGPPDSAPITAARQIVALAEGTALPAENLSDVMLNNFVDVERGSILLVFQDGEQLCHTFPLAARQTGSLIHRQPAAFWPERQ
jgi:hypothetical protein